MLRRSLILLLAVFLDILLSLIDMPFHGPNFTLMTLVARTIHGFDYATAFLAFGVGFLFDAWLLDIFGGHAITWLLTLLLISRIARFFNSDQISAHLALGSMASFVAGFIQFILWSSIYRKGIPLSAVSSQLIVIAAIDALALAILYRLLYRIPSRQTGFLVEAHR